ncbi:hypothetical protein ABW20_dc0105672 [Dactylellina cionopaga]|nr:hypothetical protein ABW20_dc0105672 [Dactylellina cionopaga]
MAKGATNLATDAEFLLCCLDAIKDSLLSSIQPNIDFSIVSKATGYATDGGARTRLRNIKLNNKPKKKVEQATTESSGVKTRGKKKVKIIDPKDNEDQEPVKSEVSKPKDSEKSKMVTRSTTARANGDKKVS